MAIMGGDNMQYNSIPTEVLVVLGFCGAMLAVSAAIVLNTRFRFSTRERGFIDFVLKEAKRKRIEKGDLPGFLFENFDPLRIEYVKSITRGGEIKNLLYISSVLEVRSYILNSYV